MVAMNDLRKSVLLVDDDDDLRRLTRHVLEANGYSVLEAADGKGALKLLDLCSPDLVVTEMMMPVMDGFSFLDLYRLGNHSAPVLALSSYEGYLNKAVEAGATSILAKPFTSEELLNEMSSMVLGNSIPRSVHRHFEGPDETHRLNAVLEMRFEKLKPSHGLKRFVERTAALFEVPICQVNIVNQDMQYSHAACGISEASAKGYPRELTFCTHAVVNRSALVVQDSAKNPFFKDNPLIRKTGLRFYAGVPLITRLGVAVGTFCLMDFKEHAFTHFDLELLSLLSKRVLAEFDAEERKARPSEPSCTFPFLSELDTELGILGRDLFFDVVKLESARCLERDTSLALFIIHSPAHSLKERLTVLEAYFPTAHFGRLGSGRLGMAVPGVSANEAKPIVQSHLGFSDFLTTTEVSRLVSPGAAEAVLSSMEAAMGAAGLSSTQHPPN
jgi:CheY-like chemotaxis protein